MSVRAVLFIAFAAVFFFVGGARSAEDDAIIAQSKYFTVYAQAGVNVSSLIERVPFGSLPRFGTALRGDLPAQKRDPSLNGVFAEALDAIFDEVSDALDIQVYDYHGSIFFLPDKKAVVNVVTSINTGSYDARAFYVHEMNTIYVSAADVTIGILGHEIAHAIMSHYFVVPPPAKVQEILSGYVEYALQRSNTVLPPGKKR